VGEEDENRSILQSFYLEPSFKDSKMIPKDTLNVALDASSLKRVQGPVPTSSEGLETPLHVKGRTVNVDAQPPGAPKHMTPEEFEDSLKSKGWTQENPDLYYGWKDPITGKMMCKSTAYLLQASREKQAEPNDKIGFTVSDA